MIEQFLEQLSATSFLEGLAAICGIVSVYFSYKEHILVYPFGIISVSIYAYLCALPSVRLYADAGVNLYYFFMSIYGWYYWSAGKRNNELKTPIRSQNFKQKIRGLLFSAMIFITIAILLHVFSNSDLPYWDALTTSLAIVGMYLMARKRIEHWYYWIACDLLCIPIYIYKGLIFTSFQYLVFTVFALLGLVAWKNKMEERAAIEN